MWRRDFVQSVAGTAGLAALGADHARPVVRATGTDWVPPYARRQQYKSLRQSSYDVTGGNADAWPIKAGTTREVFRAQGAGVITHIWFTIAADSMHLKELVLRAYWDGNAHPSVETPIGDFFGLNLGDYVIYESEYLACSPGQSLNCYFAMPYRAGARITVTNEGTRDVDAFYSNIDYLETDAIPEDALYFHAHYHQAAPNVAQHVMGGKNLDGSGNYVFCETHGRGQLMGVTLGVIQTSDGWMGEGDDMIFVDDPTRPVINGTGTEDYFLGSWDFGGRDHAEPFAFQQYGAPLIQSAEKVGGRYCLYRFHGDNPVTFNTYLKHTIEHGHANDRADNFYSCAFWYQEHPFTDFAPLPPVASRMPRVNG